MTLLLRHEDLNALGVGLPYPVVARTAPLRARRAAQDLAERFGAETGVQWVYDARYPGRDQVVLLPSPGCDASDGVVICGAVGVETEAPAVGWVYVVPEMRGRGLVDSAWPHVLRWWPGIWWSRAVTAAGARLVARLEALPTPDGAAAQVDI